MRQMRASSQVMWRKGHIHHCLGIDVSIDVGIDVIHVNFPDIYTDKICKSGSIHLLPFTDTCYIFCIESKAIVHQVAVCVYVCLLKVHDVCCFKMHVFL